MKKISVRDMKAYWSVIEDNIRKGDTYIVENHGHPTVKLTAATPGKVLRFDDHLKTAVPSAGPSSTEILHEDRDGRW